MDGASIRDISNEYLMDGIFEAFEANIDLRPPESKPRNIDLRV